MNQLSLKRKKQLLSFLPVYARYNGKWSKIPLERPKSFPLTESGKITLGNPFLPKTVDQLPSRPSAVRFNIIDFQAIMLLLVLIGCLVAIPYFLIISDFPAALFSFVILFVTFRFIFNSIEILPESIRNDEQHVQ